MSSEGMRILLAACLLIGSGCTALAASARGVSAPSPSPASWTLDPSHVFRASPGIPPGGEVCRDNAEVEAVLRAFASAFNSGDDHAIRAAVSTSFWGVFMNLPGRNEAAYTRDDAVRYLVERSQAGDRLAFGQPQVSGLVAWDGAAHFGAVAVSLRRGDSVIEVQGRGALYCAGSAKGIKILSIWK